MISFMHYDLGWIWCIGGAAASVDLIGDLTLSLTQCPLPLLF